MELLQPEALLEERGSVIDACGMPDVTISWCDSVVAGPSVYHSVCVVTCGDVFEADTRFLRATRHLPRSTLRPNTPWLLHMITSRRRKRRSSGCTKYSRVSSNTGFTVF